MAVEKLDLSALFVRSREIGLDHAVVSECLSSPDPKSLLQKEIVDAMHHAASDKQSDGSATEVRLELAEAHLDSMDDKMQKQGSQLEDMQETLGLMKSSIDTLILLRWDVEEVVQQSGARAAAAEALFQAARQIPGAAAIMPPEQQQQQRLVPAPAAEPEPEPEPESEPE